MALTVTKEYTWDMAHMLSNHKGLCQNVHGHTYKMQIEVSQDILLAEHDPASEGMVIDFKDLKNVVKSLIVDPLDHAFMGWDKGNYKEQKVIETLVDCGMKVKIVPYRPTAESMAMGFFEELCKPLRKEGIILNKVTIWETATSFASYGG